MRDITRHKGRTRLFVLWVTSCTVLFLLLMVQSFGSAFRDEVLDVWAWFLPTVMPGLLLTVGLFYSDPRGAGRVVDMVVFRVAFWGSVVYLCSVSIPLLIHPFLVRPVDVIQSSGVWLGTVQGGVVSAVTLFFVGGSVVRRP